MSFIVALLLFNFFCDEVLRSLVHDFNVDLPLNLVDLSGPLCKCKLLTVETKKQDLYITANKKKLFIYINN